MLNIVIAIKNLDARQQILKDIQSDPDASTVQIEFFSDYLSLMERLNDKKPADLLVVDYDFAWTTDSSGSNSISQAVILAETYENRDGLPVLILGPTTSNDTYRLDKLNRVKVIDTSSMYDIVGKPGRPLHVATMLTMIRKFRSPQTESPKPGTKKKKVKPRGLVELRIDSQYMVTSTARLIYPNGYTRDLATRNFALDSSLKSQLEINEQVLESENLNDKVFLLTLQQIGLVTRTILNFDATTKQNVDKLLELCGGVKKIWFRFSISNLEMSQIPFESILRCDKNEQQVTLAEFQLNYSPVFRVVGNSNFGNGEIRLPLLSGLYKNDVDQLNCLVIDATTSGQIRDRQYDQLPYRLEDISEHTASEIKMVMANLNKLDESGAIERLELVSFDTEAQRSDPAQYLEDLFNEYEWDIVHFSGHSIYLPGDRRSEDMGFIFLPGDGEPIPVHIDRVAEWFENANLVYMSSCQSAEPKFVNALADKGVPTIIGFRWQVSSRGAGQFAGLFYRNLFKDRAGDVESAFVHAQRSMINVKKYPVPKWLRELNPEDTEFWKEIDVKAGVSPLLIMQNI